MATNNNNNSSVTNAASPNLPIAPVHYSQQYQDQLNNAFRLYFTHNDNTNRQVVAAAYSLLTMHWMDMQMSNFQNIIGYKLGQAAMTTGYTTVYTVPLPTQVSGTNAQTVPDTRTFIKDITIVNTTTAPIGIYVHLVPYGSTATTDNAIFYNNALAANTTVQWTGVQILGAGDTIQVKGASAGCTVTISGAQGT